MHERAGLGHAAALAHRAPQAQQKFEIVRERVLAGAFGRGTGDHAKLRTQALVQAGDDILEPMPLVLFLDTRRHARMRLERQQHQIARRHRQQGRQPGALGAERILENLHEHVLALAQQLADRRLHQRLTAGVLRRHHVGHVQERGALQPDLDEGRLHARQHTLHPALVDVADQPVARGALDVDLLRGPVLDEGHAGFLRADVDQNLCAHNDASSVEGPHAAHGDAATSRRRHEATLSCSQHDAESFMLA